MMVIHKDSLKETKSNFKFSVKLETKKVDLNKYTNEVQYYTYPVNAVVLNSFKTYSKNNSFQQT